jgi:fermentation-respiration switch protein FrsA (DUF1100 family)
MIQGLVVGAIALTVLVASLWLFQRRLIYLPDRSVVPSPREAAVVTMTTDDGLELSAWVIPPDGPMVATVVVFNGNAGNRGHRLPLADTLSASGFEVVLFDYRGYGDAPGNPSQAGLEADARAVGRFLDERGSDPVLYFGESLGAALAVYLAGDRPPDALVLRSPFSSLADVASVHYPLLPVGLLLRDRFPVAGPIGHLDVPVLVIAGEEDSIVPLRQSRAVFDAASGPKEMIVVDGAHHNDAELAAGASLGPTVRRFLEDTMGSPPP